MKEPWWERMGVAADETLNVALFDGDPEETISKHAAEAARRGARWGCVLCRWLDLVVEPRHCQKQLEPGATRTSAALRGGLLMALLVAAIWGVAHALVALVAWAL